jgi:hypothetical protein|tara:strand:+ start:454 stop:1155 length:702 start_codon:yes stop_codon:yes gene_type:complete
MIYSVKIAYKEPVGDTQRVVGTFNFDGRTKQGQKATFVHVPDQFTTFQVEVMKKTGPVRREMKECRQKELLLMGLERNIKKLLAGENETGTDSEQNVEQTKELAEFELTGKAPKKMVDANENNSIYHARKKELDAAAAGKLMREMLDEAADPVTGQKYRSPEITEKEIEEKIVAAHKRSNDMIGKVLSNDPELRRYVTANTQPSPIDNASIAQAAVGQGSDDLLEIPSFLKRS